MDQLETLKRRLYAKDKAPAPLHRSALTEREDSPTSGWGGDADREDNLEEPKRRSWLTLFLVVALIFFLSALAFAGYTLIRGANVISPANVELVLDGPETVKAGETLNLQVLIANKNTTALNSAYLIVEFAPGTRSPLDVTKELPRTRIPLDTIKSGSSLNQTIKGVVFGEKDAEQEIKVSVEYRIADSNAIFDKVSLFRYQISSSPVTLNLNLPTEVNSGQTVNLDLELVTSSDAPVRDLVVAASYPPGFTFTSATPQPAVGTNVWRLGDLPSGARPHIKVTGKLEGQDDDPKSFRFSVGMESDRNEGTIAVNYGEVFKVVTIKRPYVALNVSVGGDGLAQEYVAGSGEPVRVDISWINNLPTEVTDGEITVMLNGLALDPRTVVANEGFYQSATNQILWSKRTMPALSRLAPGESDQVSFNFASVPLIRTNNSIITRPTIDLTVTFRGRRVTADSSSEPIETTIKKQVKLNSVFQLAAAAKYHDGPFVNSGPLPPKAGQETTYTVVWSVVNSSNEVTQATVRATLPAYVRWLGQVSPNDEQVTFDESKGEVIWNIGVVNAGRGITSAAREASFQVAFLPSVSQVGDMPVLITNPTLSGTDAFTHRTLTNTKRSLDTVISSDSRYQQNYGTVVQ